MIYFAQKKGGEMRSLEYFPVQFFAVIMGFSGLTIAFAKAYHFLHFPYFIYLVLLCIDVALFFVIFTLYIFKWIKYPDAVSKEFSHPIKSSFGAAISISFLLISIAMSDFAPPVAVTFWFIGALLHLFFTYKVMKFWILHDRLDVKHINPAWFIPIVGNVLVPVVGVDVCSELINHFYFSIGIFFWIVLYTIVMYRMIFHLPLGKRLIPTFFILIAPPAVGFISYFRITFGMVDFFDLFLYFIALFIFVLLLTMFRQFLKLQFFISWWAYTFPLAAITIATILLDSVYHDWIIKAFSIFLLFLTTVVVGYVSLKTLEAIKNQKICIPEEE